MVRIRKFDRLKSTGSKPVLFRRPKINELF
jgi:hypothetical protein